MSDRELMQQALDAMLNFPNDISDEMFESIRSLRARLAQPEQEKLGEIVPADEEQLERIAKLVKPEPQGGYRWREGDVPPSMTYTAPPQRKFIGLTDEEIEDACWTEVDQRMRSFARAIEAKLKEKNNFE